MPSINHSKLRRQLRERPPYRCISHNCPNCDHPECNACKASYRQVLKKFEVSLSGGPSSPDMVTRLLTDKASSNKVSNTGTDSPNRRGSSLATGAPQAPAICTVSVGFAALSERSNWIAQTQINVRNLQGSPIAGATITGSFSTDGGGACVTSSTGQCTLASYVPATKKVTLTDFSVTGVSGTVVASDTNQDSATRVRIARP